MPLLFFDRGGLFADRVAIKPRKADAVDKCGAWEVVREAVVLEKNRAVGDAGEGVEIVRRDDNGLPLVGTATDAAGERVGDNGVETCERFVVERDRRCCDPCGGDGDSELRTVG